MYNITDILYAFICFTLIIIIAMNLKTIRIYKYFRQVEK